ncbi:MAG: hypothetical protein WBD47_11955 [Phormidesmis sp.]
MGTPTERADTYLGNVSESTDLAQRVAQAQEKGCCWEVSIEIGDRTKGRILTYTAAGQAVGIVKTRDWLLREGDVFLSSNNNKLVVISLQAQPVMTLRFEAGAENRAIALVHLGHVLGNQHWPIVVKGDVLYVALVTEAAVMESTIRKMTDTLALKGLQIGYEKHQPVESVDFTNATHTHHLHDHPH